MNTKTLVIPRSGIRRRTGFSGDAELILDPAPLAGAGQVTHHPASLAALVYGAWLAELRGRVNKRTELLLFARDETGEPMLHQEPASPERSFRQSRIRLRRTNLEDPVPERSDWCCGCRAHQVRENPADNLLKLQLFKASNDSPHTTIACGIFLIP